MTKREPNIPDSKFLKGFFRSRLNIWVIASSTILVSGIFLYFTNMSEYLAFPGRNNVTFEFYTDRANGGNSEITNHSVTDSAININFTLKEGFLNPYVGINIMPKKDSVADLSAYNRFRIDMEGKNVKGIGISLFTRNPYYKNAGDSKELFFASTITISPGRKQYEVDLSQLKTPDWWIESNNISSNANIKPDLKHVLHFNIGTAHTPTLGADHSIRIYSILFGRNNTELALLLAFIEFSVILTLVLLHYFNAFSKKRKSPITITYQSVDVQKESQQLKSFIDYINTNFHDPDLTLEKVSDQTGINQRRIANYIQQTYSCNFKTYINQIRINESKVLLGNTDLNIGEIAFKVGFSNQSHFNRVFKSIVSNNPTEFRDSHKQGF